MKIFKKLRKWCYSTLEFARHTYSDIHGPYKNRSARRAANKKR